MKTKYRSLAKYATEFLLIVVSVLLAFIVESFRQDSQERKSYVDLLISFRNDFHEDIRDLRMMSDSTWDGMGTEQRKKLQYIDSLVRTNDDANCLAAFEMFESQIINWDDWREQSPYASELARYADYLREDSLTLIVSRYLDFYKLEFEFWRELTDTRKQFESHWYGQYDNQNLRSGRNLTIAKSDWFKFTIHELIRENERATEDDMHFVEVFTERILYIDNVLASHGIDTSKLSKEHLPLYK